MGRLVPEEEYAAEAARHADFANSTFGVLLFTISLACLQFDRPDRAALLSLIVVIPMYAAAIFLFPRTMWALRALQKEDPKNEEIKDLIQRFNTKYHGWRALPRFTILGVAFAFYLGVLLYEVAPIPLLVWVKG